LALLSIYERSRDWPQARLIAEKLDNAEQGSFASRLGHYMCEEAEQAQRAGDTEKASQLLMDTVVRVPHLARGWMALSALRAQTGQPDAAFDALCELQRHAPQALPLAARPLAELARQTGREARARELLESSNQRAPSIDVTEALATLSESPERARAQYLDHLTREPSLVMATQWLTGEHFSDAKAQAQVQAALTQASAPLKRYRCAACGFEAQQHFWHCPGCQAWDSYPARRVEEL
jgi:lipopolysaccharide biosynthesis regulator YciM